MNALLRASGLITNGQFLFNLDCDHYINNCQAVRDVSMLSMLASFEICDSHLVSEDVCNLQKGFAIREGPDSKSFGNQNPMITG